MIMKRLCHYLEGCIMQCSVLVWLLRLRSAGKTTIIVQTVRIIHFFHYNPNCEITKINNKEKNSKYIWKLDTLQVSGNDQYFSWT